MAEENEGIEAGCSFGVLGGFTQVCAGSILATSTTYKTLLTQ